MASITISDGVTVVCRDRVAVIKNISGNKITLKTESGEKIVKAKEIIPIHPGPAAALPLLQKSTLTCEEAAELIGNETIAFEEFASLLFEKYTPDTAWSAYTEVVTGVWFSFSDDNMSVICKDAGERAKLIAERESKEAEKRRRAELLERVRAREIVEEDKIFLREIESVALGKSENSKLLKELEIEASPEKAHKLLLELGVWDLMRNPWCERMKEDTSTPQFQPESPKPKFPRTDLTHLPAYAIDDRTSNDPDDALSFADGLLYVHIADPAEYIEFGSETEREASLRGESLYLPELLSPMLPEELRLKCALGLEKKNNAITFVLSINDTGDVNLENMMLSEVSVTRLTYEDCADILNEENFSLMNDALERFRQFRINNGARLIRLPEVKIKAAGTQVEITPLPLTFERELVANAMLAAGYAVAKKMASENINFPFINQAAPDEEPEGETLSAMYARRRTSKTGKVDFKAGLHSGLGLEPYSRVTSPLRRYADLLAHYQLRSVITGTEPLSFEELESRITYAENAAAGRRKLEKYSNEYYTIVYLAQHPGYETTAVLAAKQNGQLTFIIPELAYEYKCRMQGSFELDEEYKLTLITADPAAMRTVFKVERE